MHGYDVYEYGFRGYYATIARFTSIDPLCERTPWQSPYTYASNNFTGEIDWMGLFGSTGFASGGYGTYQWTAVNGVGTVIDSDMSSSDTGVYLVDDDWDGTYSGLSNYWQIGWQIPGIIYRKGGIYDFLLLNGDIFSAEFKSAMAYNGYTYQFGYYKESSSSIVQSSIYKDVKNQNSNYILYFWNGATSYIGLKGNMTSNEIYWLGKNGNLYLHYQIHTRGGYAYSYKLANEVTASTKVLGKLLAPVSLGLEVIDVVQARSVGVSNGINSVLIIGSCIPGIGGVVSIVAASYFIVDSAFLLTTGVSLNQRIDNKMGRWNF